MHNQGPAGLLASQPAGQISHLSRLDTGSPHCRESPIWPETQSADQRSILLLPDSSTSSPTYQTVQRIKAKHIPIDISYLISNPDPDRTVGGERPRSNENPIPTAVTYLHHDRSISTHVPQLRHIPIVITPPQSGHALASPTIGTFAIDLDHPSKSLFQDRRVVRSDLRLGSRINNPGLGLHSFDMNNSQTSLTGQESYREGTNGTSRNNNAAPGSGASPAIAAQGGLPVGGAGPTNLSGLVCNVHRTTGKEPHALVGATTTILGDKLYVFGGKILSRTRPQLTSDLYELDLIRRHWTKIDATGDIPPARYFHSMCALGDTKLVCYGGMSPVPTSSTQSNSSSTNTSTNSDPPPEVVVMSDIHIYDVPTRSWTIIQTAETPQGRYAHCATVLPSSAVFTSADAPLGAIHNNPSSTNPHQGSIGVAIDGSGGAEMVVVGGQDSSNHYIEQISVFNLRSLKWTATSPLGRQCGAYRSVVAPLTGMHPSAIGMGNSPEVLRNPMQQENGSSMLIYSNYNFLDVKLELQVRYSDGKLVEKSMSSQVSPPGLRFPNGGVIDGHFVVSGTYLTSSKQEYALWALDLKTLTWGRIDAGGSVFSHGSWNRGVLWNRRNTFVILGNRKRSLVDDYNHRRINFSHVCMVELEAFGLYDNPRKTSPTSGYVSISSPSIPASVQSKLASQAGGGRPYSSSAEQLGQAALSIRELADMDLVAIGGERIPVNSHMLARRWGPYFTQLLKDSAASHDPASDAATLRPQMHSQASRNSSITITPSIGGGASTYSTATTLTANNAPSINRTLAFNFDPPDVQSLPPASRPRSLYLPHTHATIQLLVRYLYTSALPPITSNLCTPQILCSLLQLARPYQIDGLLEATVERIHQVLDGRNAAAVFNAAAMAAGGGRGTGMNSGGGGTLQTLNEAANNTQEGNAFAGDAGLRSLTAKAGGLKINTTFANGTSRGAGGAYAHERGDSTDDGASSATSTTDTDISLATPSDSEAGGRRREDREEREVWTGDVSSVVGLQKRGLRGLMEGRRLRERVAPGPNPGAGGGTGAGRGVPAGNGIGVGQPQSGNENIGSAGIVATGVR